MDIFTLIKNFSQEALTFVSQGAPIVSQEVYKKRLTICNNCEFLKGSACGKCGCNMAVKCKWGTASCPINKWGVDTK